MDKVIGGTPKTEPPLCNSCSYGLIMKGLNLERAAMCLQGMGLPIPIPFHVAECSKYCDKSKPSQYEMEKIAWTIETRNRGPKGFVAGMSEIVISPPKKEGE